jgi:hypothetical protein
MFLQRVKKGLTDAKFDPNKVSIHATKHTLDESTCVFLQQVTGCAGCSEERKLFYFLRR